MGCAGSRPHLLPSLSSHHSNSPQKGFILFDAKTIEYLKANELEIKTKLKQRCEQKFTKVHHVSKSSLLSSAKRTLLMSGSSTNNALNGSTSEAPHGLKSNKSNISLTDSSIHDISFKSNVINSAVDYVLRYALNDFDIENFKSSNHLSLKQIRKEIMKKNSHSKVSSSKLNSSLSMNNASAINSNTTNASLTSSSTVNDFSVHNKSFDPVFYKQALNTAIDEFGAFIQENFIVINEFQCVKAEIEESVQAQENNQIKEAKNENENDLKEKEEDDALKLKEALALARQNFYKGKVSTVCLTKTGGYVVKEVKDNQAQETEGLVIVSNFVSDVSVRNEPCKDEIEASSRVEVATNEQKHIDDNLEQIKQLINKAFNCNTQEKLTINEFFMIKTHLVNLLNETIESIVNYTTKSSPINEASNDQFNFDINAAQHADLLISNLEKSKRIIENLNFIEEDELNSIDEKLVEAILNLDYVNKEFKSYLKILEDSQINDLENKKQFADQFEDYIANAQVLLDKNIKIRMLADQIDELNSKLPKRLFACKCLPHPSEAVQIITEQTYMGKKETIESKEELTVSSPDNSGNSIKELDENEMVDIKKEIAISILNVGEILAKTIDHLSNEPEEIKNNEAENKPLLITDINVDDLIDVGSDQLHVNIALNQEENIEKQNKQECATEASGSTISSMSSPSVSTSSMSPSESISSNPKQEDQQQSKEGDELKANKCNLVEANVSNMDLIEKFKCAPEDNHTHLNELSYLVNEVSANMVSQLNYLDKYERRYKNDENDSFSDHQLTENLDKVKSSSSSSDILTNSNNYVDSSSMIQQSDRNDENIQPVKFRNGSDKPISRDMLIETNTNKRMSLDEELFYHLEEVDKKVKYMNETCSENEDEDDNDEGDFDYDESADLENGNDDERLFHPRTPAKIKSDIKSHRSADLQNEIKQISNVIQDLVQTINVRNSSGLNAGLVHTKIDIIEEVNDNNGHLILSSFEDNNSDSNNNNNNPDSEDGGSQNSADSTDISSTPSSKMYYRHSSNKKNEGMKRLSLNSNSNNNSFSNIPIRQKILTKQKATTIEDEQNELTSNKILSTSVNYEAFVDVTTLIKQQQEQVSSNSTDILNKSSSSQKFRSKLPVKK